MKRPVNTARILHALNVIVALLALAVLFAPLAINTTPPAGPDEWRTGGRNAERTVG